MPPRVGFRNSYEESKYESEILIRKTSLPWTIFRPSIIVGDSRTFDSQGENRMVYGFVLGIYYSILKKYSKEEFVNCWENGNRLNEIIRVLGHETTTKNFICIDDVVNIMLEVIKNSNNYFKTYHLINEEYLSLGEMAIATTNALKLKNIDVLPQIPNLTPIEKRLINFTRPFRPYCLNDDPVWDTTNVDNVLKNHKRVKMTPQLFENLMKKFVEKEIIEKAKNG